MRKIDHDYFIDMESTRAHWMRQWEESLSGIDTITDTDLDLGEYQDPEFLAFPSMYMHPPEDQTYQI